MPPDTRVRAAMVCSQAPPVYGGAGTQAHSLARELLGFGVVSEVLTQNQLKAPRTETLEGVLIRRAPGERVISLLPRRVAEVVRTGVFLLWVTAQLSLRRYDIIHLHGNYWFGVPATLVARLTGRRLIVKVTRLGEDDAQTVRAKRIGRFPVGRLYGLPFRFADLTIALSREIEERQLKSYPSTPVKLQPNGVDVGRFQGALPLRGTTRKQYGIAADEHVALFVGYLAPHKGVGELLEAWSAFTRERDGTLLLVGPSSGFYRELQDDVLGKARQAGRVQVVDFVPFKEMPAVYAMADVYLLPSQAEGMPNSFLEALASGLPSIVSRVPGIIEVLERGVGAVGLDEISGPAIRRALEEVSVAPAGDRTSRLPEDMSLTTVAATYAHEYRRLVGLPAR